MHYTLPTWVADVVEKHGIPVLINPLAVEAMYTHNNFHHGQLIGSESSVSSLWWKHLNLLLPLVRQSSSELDIEESLNERDKKMVFGSNYINTPKWFLCKSCIYISVNLEPMLLGILSNNEEYCIRLSTSFSGIKTFEGMLINNLDALRHYFIETQSRLVGSTIC